MAKWILACKEVSGKLYVTRLTQTTNDPPIPGVPEPWVYIGPGSRPSVSNYDGGNRFIIVFDYLSHLTARVFDVSAWPPQQVDPVTTNPISIGTGNPPQGPEEALFISYKSAVASGRVQFYFTPPMLKNNPIQVTGTTFSYRAQTDATQWTVDAPTPYSFRLYRRPLTGGTWTLLMDWTPAPLDYTDNQTGSLQYQYAATVGALWDPANPNDKTKLQESAFGAILHKDSATEPLEYQAGGEDTYSYSHTPLQTFAATRFAAKQLFSVEAFEDTLSAKVSASPSSAHAEFYGYQVWAAPQFVEDQLLAKSSPKGNTSASAAFGDKLTF